MTKQHLVPAQEVSFDPATGVTVWKCSCGHVQTVQPARYDPAVQQGYYGDSLHFCDVCGAQNHIY